MDNPKSFYVLIVLIFAFFSSLILCQKSCTFTESKDSLGDYVYIQHLSSGKCMRVKALGLLANSNIVLQTCAYGESSTSLDQRFKFTNGSFNALNLKTLGGTGNYYCAATKYEDLTSQTCQSQNFDQHWVIKPVRFNSQYFLIEHYNSRKCLIPIARGNGSPITLTPCNSYQTEQIWKLCKH